MKVTRASVPFLAVVFSTIVLIAAACGSDATPTTAPTPTSSPASPISTPTLAPTPTPTEVTTPTSEPTPSNPQSVELTRTQVFAEFPFSIAYPEGWTVEINVPATIIRQFPEDSPRRAEGYSVSLDHRDLAGMYAMGLPENPTLEDLLQLNNTFFGWGVLTAAFGAPALVIEAKISEGVVSMVMGFVGGEAYLLMLRAPTQEAFDDFRLVWAGMLDSIQPVELATTAGEKYFEEVRGALELADLRFAKVTRLLDQSYPTRERVIEALLEGGAGTVFTATVEALDRIEPPGEYAEGHRELVETHLELASNDGEVGVALREGNLLTFGLLNGQSTELRVSLPPYRPRTAMDCFRSTTCALPWIHCREANTEISLTCSSVSSSPSSPPLGGPWLFHSPLARRSFSALLSRWPPGWSR